MSRFVGKSNIKEATIEAIVTRANGEVEDLGIIAKYKYNPVKEFFVTSWIKFKKIMKGM